MSVPKPHLRDAFSVVTAHHRLYSSHLMGLGDDASFPSMLFAKVWTNLSPRFTQSFLKMVSPK